MCHRCDSVWSKCPEMLSNILKKYVILFFCTGQNFLKKYISDVPKVNLRHNGKFDHFDLVTHKFT